MSTRKPIKPPVKPPEASRRRSAKWSGLEAEARVQHALVQAVMERRLKPGTKLDEEVLAEVFNISRTRLRNVLSQLATQLIVTHKPGYGTFTAKPTVAEARDVFQARHGIEDMLIHIVGGKYRSLDFTPLHEAVEKETHAHEHHDADAIEFACDFHLALADLAGNRLLASYMRQLVMRTILVQAVYSSRHVCLVDDHRQILAMLERGDATAAARIMSRHLQTIEESCVLHDDEDDPTDLRSIFLPFSRDADLA